MCRIMTVVIVGLAALCASVVPASAQNLVVNPSFESSSPGSGWPSGYGMWSGDAAASVTAQQGVVPAAGSRMLKFVYGGPSASALVACQVRQIIDVRGSMGLIRANGAAVTLKALFNRVQLDAQTDTRFILQVYAFAGAPSTAPTQLESGSWIAQHFAELLSDSDILTWQTAEAIMHLPVNTDFVCIEVAAYENVHNDTSGTEFDGHYCDLVECAVLADPTIRLSICEAVASMVAQVGFEGGLPYVAPPRAPVVNGIVTLDMEDLASCFALFGSHMDRIALYGAGESAQLLGHIAFSYTYDDYRERRGVYAYVFVHNDEPPMTPSNARDWPYKVDGWEYYDEGEYPVSMLIPPGMSAVVPGNVAKTPVLFVHGINTGFDNCWENVPELVNSSTYECWRFEYPHDSAIDKNAHLLGLAVDRVLHGGIPGHTGYSADRIALVAHSMGGLVARQYIQSAEYFHRGAVSKLLMFGTPNHGSYSSYRSRYDRDFLTVGSDGLNINDPAAPAHEMMTPGSQYLTNLNALAPRTLATGLTARDYLVVAGVRDYPIPGTGGLTLPHREIFRQDDGFVAAASASLLEWGIPLALSDRHHMNLKLQDESNDATGIIEFFLNPSYNPTISTPNLPNAVFCFLDDYENVPCRDDHNVDDKLGILEFRILNVPGSVDRYRIDLPDNQSSTVMNLTANAGASLGDGNRYLKRITSGGNEFFSIVQRQTFEKEIAFWAQEGTYDLRFYDGSTHWGTFPAAVDFHPLGTASATIALDATSCVAINAPNQSRLTRLKAAPLSYEYAVDATVDTLVFSLSSETSPADFSRHDFRLVDPNGRTIDVATALADPALDVFENTEYGPIQYLIPNPVPGTWRLQHDDSVPAPAVHAYLYAGFRATLAVVGHEHAAGDSLVCRVTVSGAADCTTQNQGLTLALTRPGETAPVNLGPAPLIDLGGGQFEALIGDLESGQYRLTLDVACQDSELGSLVRTAVLDVWVDRAADDVSSVHDDDPQQSPAVDVPMRIRSAAPNPFNPQTTIAYEIPARQAVRMAIYDLSGRLVRRLLESEVQEAGSYEVVWNGRSDNGTIMSSGVYFCRVEAGGRVQTIKLALLK